MKTINTAKITATDKTACFQHSVGLSVTDTMYARLERKGLAEKRGTEWALTEKGADVAAGRR